MATFWEAHRIIDLLAKSNDKCIISYNLKGVKSDRMMEAFTPDQARVSINTLYDVAITLGTSIEFTIGRWES